MRVTARRCCRTARGLGTGPSTATDTTRTQPSNAQNQTTQQNQTSQTQVTQRSNLFTDKQVRISETLTRERLAQPERNLNVSIRIGERIPERARVHRLPDTIVAIEPEYRGYDYFTTEEEIVIVQPRTHQIVSQIPRDRSRIRAADDSGLERRRINLGHGFGIHGRGRRQRTMPYHAA